ncbi:MAG: DUF309 domain-containing protein [Chloroflexi bacterium]|nr:DUF309 domain-containing protein [Chloroflexota bacterium]
MASSPNNLDRHLVVALVQDELLQSRIAEIANALDAEVIWNPVVKGVVKTVAELRPMVLLVDLAYEEMGWWNIIWTLKTNPATRRLAVIGFARELTDDIYAHANGLVIDEIFEAQDDAHGRYLTTLRERIEAYARRSDSELQAAVAEASNFPLPPLVHQGLQEFNAGEYYEAHETIEHAWVDEPGVIRTMYRGILQIAVAYYHIKAGNYRGALKMFLRSLQWLEPLPDTCQRIDIARLRQDARQARQEMERLGPERLHEFDLSLLKPVRYDETFVAKES